MKLVIAFLCALIVASPRPAVAKCAILDGQTIMVGAARVGIRSDGNRVSRAQIFHSDVCNVNSDWYCYGTNKTIGFLSGGAMYTIAFGTSTFDSNQSFCATYMIRAEIFWYNAVNCPANSLLGSDFRDEVMDTCSAQPYTYWRSQKALMFPGIGRAPCIAVRLTTLQSIAGGSWVQESQDQGYFNVNVGLNTDLSCGP